MFGCGRFEASCYTVVAGDRNKDIDLVGALSKEETSVHRGIVGSLLCVRRGRGDGTHSVRFRAMDLKARNTSCALIKVVACPQVF